MLKNELEKKTQNYWRVSYCWHGRKGSGQMTVEEALKACRSIRTSFNPAKKLARHALALSLDIIKNQAEATTKTRQADSGA